MDSPRVPREDRPGTVPTPAPRKANMGNVIAKDTDEPAGAKMDTPRDSKENPPGPTPAPRKTAKDKDQPAGEARPKKPKKTDSEKSPPEKPKPEPPKEKKKLFWLTRQMAEEFDRQDVLFSTFKEALLYCLFLTAVTFATMGRRSVMFFHQTEAVKSQFIEKDFKTLNDVDIKFKDIKSPSDFWFYAENALIENLYWEKYYSDDGDASVAPVAKDDRKILYENLLLGVPRIRQVKVPNDSCIIHPYFKRLFLSCYDTYTPADEDREPFGPGKGTAWVYNKPEKTASISYTGDISTYEGGGFYRDFSVDKETSRKIITELKDNLWITRGTRVIFIDFSLYNANLAFFMICKLVFEFPPTGGILPSHQFQTVRFLRSGFWDEMCFYFECLMYLISGFFLIEEIREIMYFKWRYFLQFWTYIDIIVISLSAANCLTSWIVFPSADKDIIRIVNNPTRYGNLEYLGQTKILYNNLAAALLFFSYMKIFKYLSFNKTMGQLNNTLKNCAWDIVGFSVMFFIIFFAFAELGYLIFGSQVEDFSSFGISMFTLLRTLLGDFEYPAIEKANRVVAPIYFLSYIFFVFFVLLNMFLAIINDTYADVKTEISIAPEEMQMTEFLENKFYECLQKCGFKIGVHKEAAEFKATIGQIREALRKCGFSDMEIEMFFSRYNIGTSETENYDIKKMLKELEGLTQDKTDEDTPLIHINDFLTQQERLDEIERSVQSVAAKVDALVKKLETLGNVTVRKNRAQR